ncbi:MAG: hypothetical protein AAF989_08015 [Planctomycetota bacterium]
MVDRHTEDGMGFAGHAPPRNPANAHRIAATKGRSPLRKRKQEALDLIAMSDNNGDEAERLDAKAIMGYISVRALAASWGQEPKLVAESVVARRKYFDKIAE